MNILHIGRNEAAGYFYYVMELADSQETVVSGPSSVASAASSQPENHPLARAAALEPDTYAPRTLRSDLKRRGRLPFTECLDIALGVN